MKVIRQIAKLLTKEHGFCDILPVTRAKVPIVRFYHREHRLEGDISLYNILVSFLFVVFTQVRFGSV